MDIRSLDTKMVKTVYIILAAIMAVGAIGAAYLHQTYVALVFIVLASAIIMVGALFVSYLIKNSRIKDLD